MMRRYLILIVSATIFANQSTQAKAGAGDPLSIVMSGSCQMPSNINYVAQPNAPKNDANGFPYYCDAAVVSFMGDDSRHIMIQFSSKASSKGRILGFAGFADRNVDKVGVTEFDIRSTYISGRRFIPTSGKCSMFTKGGKLDGIVCAAKVDTKDETLRTTVNFGNGVPYPID